MKDAHVFINRAYAGTTHNKTMHLRPGAYKIEIREGGHDRPTTPDMARGNGARCITSREHAIANRGQQTHQR